MRAMGCDSADTGLSATRLLSWISSESAAARRFSLPFFPRCAAGKEPRQNNSPPPRKSNSSLCLFEPRDEKRRERLFLLPHREFKHVNVFVQKCGDVRFVFCREPVGANGTFRFSGRGGEACTCSRGRARGCWCTWLLFCRVDRQYSSAC